ncbi:hypothetical protein CC86DRAFT_452656 [Ophiobolus disseminans]|uniref:Yeast cell wall synthesis Kre9/Knh1-like N-terminal domain-containing protein n=1 Tax=Ophiobolus disseminans TaxID=1469910 RepID=A0A6A7AED1_9PLEO|nr:hypothetical protein CC86DRAFT_452656 [Ophiobolus disseminans]
MRFFEVVVSGAALISTAFAATIDTYPTAGVEAGKTYTVTYSPKDQPVTFVLRRGLSTNLDTVGTLGTATGGSFSWTVASNLANAPNYALEVRQEGSAPNYSGQFGLTGGSGSLSSAIASASSAASAAASSAAASASAAISSIRASASSVAASATILPSAGANSTIVSPTISRTGSASVRPTGTGTGTAPPESTGAASMLSSSPLALIFGAVAAFAYLA